MLHLTLLIFMELVEDGEKFGGGGRQSRHTRIFHSPSRLTITKALVRSTEKKAAYKPMFCSLYFSCMCLNMKIMFMVPLLDLNPHWLSGVFFDASQDFACNGEQSDASVV